MAIRWEKPMPTKRRRLTNRQISIPPAAIEAWRIGDKRALDAALGIKPWQESPFYADDPEPPSWMTRQDSIDDWAHAWEMRCRLIAVAGEPGGVGRHGQPLGPGQPNYHPHRQEAPTAGLAERVVYQRHA
jgi:hypothetical protein